MDKSSKRKKTQSQILVPQQPTTANIVSNPTPENIESLDLANRAQEEDQSQVEQNQNQQQAQPQSFSHPAAQKSASGKPNDPTSALATITNDAINSGAAPSDLDFAYKHLDSQDYYWLCEKFVENAQGRDHIYRSAAEAWQEQQDSAVQGLNGIKPGDALYFAPDESNAYDGHTGIYSGNGNFISATAKGVKELPIAAWQQLTGQQVTGYIPQQAGGGQ